MGFFRDLFRCIFVWWIKPASEEEIAKAHAIATTAHGLTKSGKPSPGDTVLAMMMTDLHLRFPDKPIIPQEPVALAAPDIAYFAIAKPPTGNIFGSSNMAWNTRTVARFDADACRERGCKRVVLVAASWAAPRMKWELERCGMEVLVAKVPPYRKRTHAHPGCIYWYGRGGLWRCLLVEATRGRAHYMSYWLEGLI